MPDPQLRYILKSIIEHMIHSLPFYGGMGFLTRVFDLQGWNGEEKDLLQGTQKYVEVLMVSIRYEKQSSPFEGSPGIPNHPNGDGIDLILHLVKEIVQKHRGVLQVKPYNEKGMIFVYLILPIERRRVVRFLSAEGSERRNQAGDSKREAVLNPQREKG